MIIINLYEIIINLLALATALVLIPIGIFLWIFLITFLYKTIKDYLRQRSDKRIKKQKSYHQNLQDVMRLLIISKNMDILFQGY